MALSDWSEKQLLAVTAGAFAAVLAVLGGVDYWVYSQSRDLERRAGEVENRVRATENSTERLKLELEELKQVIPEAIEHEKKLPDCSRYDDEGLLTINRWLASMKVQTGASQIQPPRERLAAAKEGELYATRGVNLRGTATFHALGRLIDRIERGDGFAYLAKVEALSVNNPEARKLDRGSQELNFSLDLAVYCFKEETK
jgi:hypothetical protein